jgi:glycosyltransferase involved in cell wall biosynthesis
MNQIGVVTIGRNEGDRLVKCLQSLKAQLPPDATIIYVDSKSTDDSIGRAKSLNIEVVELDMTIPFTAGRARKRRVSTFDRYRASIKICSVC